MPIPSDPSWTTGDIVKASDLQALYDNALLANTGGTPGGAQTIPGNKTFSGNTSFADLQADAVTNSTGLAYGTFTPTISNTTNLSSTTARECRYIRIGDMVFVSGYVTVDPVSTGTIDFEMSLPIASNLADVFDCAGTAGDQGTGESGGIVVGITANDTAKLSVVTDTTNSHAVMFSYGYTVK